MISNYTYDFWPSCTLLSSITITYQFGHFFLHWKPYKELITKLLPMQLNHLSHTYSIHVYSKVYPHFKAITWISSLYIFYKKWTWKVIQILVCCQKPTYLFEIPAYQKGVEQYSKCTSSRLKKITIHYKHFASLLHKINRFHEFNGKAAFKRHAYPCITLLLCVTENWKLENLDDNPDVNVSFRVLKNHFKVIITLKWHRINPSFDFPRCHASNQHDS